MALSRLEKQVARLAADLSKPDSVLQLLLRLTDLDDIGHIGLRISVVTGGHVIQGNLMGSRAYVERLDEELGEGMTKFAERVEGDDVQQEAAAQWRDAIAGAFTKAYRSYIDGEAEHDKTVKGIAEERDTDLDALELDDLPDDVAEADIVLHPDPPRTVLTLSNAVLHIPPIREEPIGIVRIPIAQIGAWWLNMGLGDESDDSDD